MARFFELKHKRYHTEAQEVIPIARATMPSSITGLTGMYYALLRPLGSPYSDPLTRVQGRGRKIYEEKEPPAMRKGRVYIAELEHELIKQIKRTGVKMYIIDEFQHLIGRRKKELIDQLKTTMINCEIPFIPMGIPTMRKIVLDDVQLARRCPITPYAKFNNWEAGKELVEFIKGYMQFMPFQEHSSLVTDEVKLDKFFEKVAQVERVDMCKLLTYDEFKEWVSEKRKKILKNRTDLWWKKLVINDDLYRKVILDMDLFDKINVDNELTIKTNLGNVTEYIINLSLTAINMGEKCITEEIIDATPF